MSEDIIAANKLMPDSDVTKKLLQSRAIVLAKPFDMNDEPEDESIYLRFKLNNENLYGIPQLMLDEVIDTADLTQLSWLPPFIAGVINWKGVVLSVLDTNYLCSKKNIESVPDIYRIIVVTNGKNKIGLLVNEIDEFYTFKQLDLKNSLQSPIEFNKDYFLGLLNDSVVLLNIDMLLTDVALEIK